MGFKWNLDVQEVSVSCNKRTLTLKRNGTVEFNTPYCNTMIPLSDIGGINVVAPKLLSKGVIGILDQDKTLIRDKEEFSISCEIVKKQEKQFNQFISIMKENGIEVRNVG